MAKFDQDGGRVPTDLFEAAAWHYSIVATCRRGRSRLGTLFFLAGRADE